MPHRTDGRGPNAFALGRAIESQHPFLPIHIAHDEDQLAGNAWRGITLADSLRLPQ
jgi:hypothetical protein